MRRSHALLALGAVLLSFLVPFQTQATTPVIDYAHIAQSIAHYIARAEEIRQKYTQIENQIRQIENDLKNLQQIPGVWRQDVERLLIELSDIIQQGEAIVYSRSDLEDLWHETFPGLVRIDREEYPEGWYEVYAQAAQRTLDTQWGVMRNVRHQSTRFHTSQETLTEIKLLSETAEGNLEVAQAGNMFLAFMAEEQTKNLQMLTAATNAIVVAEAFRLSREMQAIEEVQRMLEDARLPVEPLSPHRRIG